LSGSSLVRTRSGTRGVFPMRSVTPLMTGLLMYGSYHAKKAFGNGAVLAVSRILLNLLRRVIALSVMLPLFIHYGQTLYSR